MHDTEEEALAFQLDPKGRGWLGDKKVMRVAFRPWEYPWATSDPAVTYPGPETVQEALRRVRAEMLLARLRKAGDDPEKMAHVEKELEPTDEELAVAWDALRVEAEAKAARAAKKAAKLAVEEEEEDVS